MELLDGSHCTLDPGSRRMCLGVPGQVIDLQEIDGLKMGRVDFGGVRRLVCLEHVDASVGDHVLVHVGFALTKLPPEEAAERRRLLASVAAELDPDGPPHPEGGLD